MSETPTLPEFILACTEEEQDAALGGMPCMSMHAPTVYRGGAMVRPGRIIEYGERRVLADCEARRLIVAEHEHVDVTYADGSGTGRGCIICEQDRDYGTLSGPMPDGWCLTLRAVALPYADHPDYRPEWRP